MTIPELLPVIIPAFLIQLIVQAYYIHHCWNHPHLAGRKKTLFIVAIALFHLPAAAIYLFATRSHESEMDDPTNASGPGSQTAQGIFVMLLIAFEIFTFRALFMNPQSGRLLALLLGACFTAMIADGLLRQHLRGRQERWTGLIFSALQIALILVALWLDQSQNAQFMVLVVLAAIINRQPLRRGAVLSAMLFVGFTAVNAYHANRLYGSINTEEGISSLYIQVLSYLLIFIVFYSLKWQLQSNHQLSHALQELRTQSLQLEEMSAAAERSRVVGQIHDTVGHTLTTAVIALEAGEKLAEQDPAAASERYHLAGHQVRSALQDLRNSVRTIQSGIRLDFKAELQQLLTEVEQNANLTSNLVVEGTVTLLPLQQTILIRAIRECITNSLRHGHSKQIDLLIQHSGDRLHLAISDDGSGCAEFEWGFGLQNMQRQIEAIGGTIQADSEPGEGFTVSLVIPVANSETELTVKRERTDDE